MDELLAQNDSFKIHDCNLQKLLILFPKIMNEVYDIAECSYPLNNYLRFMTRNIRPASYEIEKAALVGLGIWNYISSKLKYYEHHQSNLSQKNVEARKLFVLTL